MHEFRINTMCQRCAMRSAWALMFVALTPIVAFAPSAAGGSEVTLTKFQPTDSMPNDEFGYSVDIDGSTAIVGARFGSENGPASGAAYLLDASTGTQLMKLLPEDGASNDQFGFAVAIHGALAVVGAPLDDDNGINSGSAYVFDTVTGRQVSKLLPLDGMTGREFGTAVALHGTTAIVADSPGLGVYVFDAETGDELGQLVTDEGVPFGFGSGIAIDETHVLVGASAATGAAPTSGAAYLFDRATQEQVFKLFASDGTSVDRFGTSVDLDGTIAIIGAPRNDEQANDAGAAYLFDCNTGQQLAKLLAEEWGSNDRFGFAVAISGEHAIVGARWDDHDLGMDDVGSAYLFDVASGRQIVKILPDDPLEHIEFGRAVALDGLTAIIGAPADDNFMHTGATYIASIASQAIGDLDKDGSVGVSDLLILLGAWGECGDAADCPADFDGDLTVGVSDLLILLGAWG